MLLAARALTRCIRVPRMMDDAMKERDRPAVRERDAIRPHVGVLERERAFPESGISFPERPYMTTKHSADFRYLK